LSSYLTRPSSLAEQNDEWAVARRYMGADLLAKARNMAQQTDDDDKESPNRLAAAAGYTTRS